MSDDGEGEPDSESGDDTAGRQPQISGRAQTKEGLVEVTVTGSDGETSDDLEDTFDHAVDHLAEKADADSSDPEGGAFQ